MERYPAPPALRVLMVGGGRLEPALLRQALTLGWPVYATYGMTETASQVASQALDHDHLNDPETLEVLPHWDARTDENETLLLRGPSLAKGYIFMAATGPVWHGIDSESGLVTRDRVQLTCNGTRSFLKFLGRNHSFLKILGELVHLDALEQRFLDLCPAGFPSIALLALPDPRREHRLALVIECADPPAEVTSVVASFQQQSAPYERLSHLLCVPQLPRAELGKLARQSLEKMTIAALANGQGCVL